MGRYWVSTFEYLPFIPFLSKKVPKKLRGLCCIILVVFGHLFSMLGQKFAMGKLNTHPSASMSICPFTFLSFFYETFRVLLSLLDLYHVITRPWFDPFWQSYSPLSVNLAKSYDGNTSFSFLPIFIKLSGGFYHYLMVIILIKFYWGLRET